MLIAEFGEMRTEEIVRGWVANLATDVFSSDVSCSRRLRPASAMSGW